MGAAVPTWVMVTCCTCLPAAACRYASTAPSLTTTKCNKVVEFLKKAGEPEYIDEILQGNGSDIDGDGGDIFGGGGEASGEVDALYDEAVRIVTETRKASISGVQRRLKIGYNRAARLVETMEEAGLVGPLQSNGSREVLAPPPPKD
jgi:DNA segregation ATPase FtsK/SpoIIIE, S-DNA-T family